MSRILPIAFLVFQVLLKNLAYVPKECKYDRLLLSHVCLNYKLSNSHITDYLETDDWSQCLRRCKLMTKRLCKAVQYNSRSMSCEITSDCHFSLVPVSKHLQFNSAIFDEDCLIEPHTHDLLFRLRRQTDNDDDHARREHRRGSKSNYDNSNHKGVFRSDAASKNAIKFLSGEDAHCKHLCDLPARTKPDCVHFQCNILSACYAQHKVLFSSQPQCRIKRQALSHVSCSRYLCNQFVPFAYQGGLAETHKKCLPADLETPVLDLCNCPVSQSSHCFIRPCLASGVKLICAPNESCCIGPKRIKYSSEKQHLLKVDGFFEISAPNQGRNTPVPQTTTALPRDAECRSKYELDFDYVREAWEQPYCPYVKEEQKRSCGPGCCCAYAPFELFGLLNVDKEGKETCDWVCKPWLQWFS